MATISINNTRFGNVSVPADTVVTFTKGLIGFGDVTRFVLLKAKETVYWLQAVDLPGLALPLVPANLVDSTYSENVEVTQTRAEHLADASDETTAFLVLNAPAGRRPTVNMMAPIFIDPVNTVGCQVLIESNDLPLEFEFERIAAEPAQAEAEKAEQGAPQPRE